MTLLSAEGQDRVHAYRAADGRTLCGLVVGSYPAKATGMDWSTPAELEKVSRRACGRCRAIAAKAAS